MKPLCLTYLNVFIFKKCFIFTGLSWKMGMRFGTWNVRSLCSSGLSNTVLNIHVISEQGIP
jgi:hypothetical protein